METLREILSEPTVRRLLALAAGLVIVVVLVRLVNRSLGRLVHDAESRYRARKGITFLGYLAVALLAVSVYGANLAGLGVTLGVAGAGVAFALQEVIASVAGWFAIAMAGFFRTGDRIQLGGIRGDVIDIGVLRTTLMEVGEWVRGDLYSGRTVRIANSFVFKEPVFNYSGEFPFLWDEIVVPIRYGSDWREARRILERTAAEVVGEYARGAAAAWDRISKMFLVESATVDPVVTMTLTDNWVELTLRYAVDFRSRRQTKDLLFTRILETIEATSGKVVVASTTVEMIPAAGRPQAMP
ncbi:MAG: mechanosensitive ion channel family protein [Gemmatimonadales bacterium]